MVEHNDFCFQVGTLDQLVSLSDELQKVDQFTEQVTRKLANYLGDVLEDQRDKLAENLQVSPSAAGTSKACLSSFSWLLSELLPVKNSQ